MISLSLSREREQSAIVVSTLSSYMQTEEDPEKDPLLHELPLNTLIAWTRWWHLTAKALTIVLKKKVFGVVGFYLKGEKERIDDRIKGLRTDWSARGRELKRLDKIKQQLSELTAWLLLEIA